MSEAATNCPTCGDAHEPSASLGHRLYYRCTSCGWWWDALNENADET
jgi:tRNA(Ile2) C34 agmatinyltransferase TiaS